MRTLRKLVAAAVFCALPAITLMQPVLAADPAEPAADNNERAVPEASGQPSATLEVASEQMRLIMGGTAGRGVLHFNGADYPFTYKSASAGVGGKVVKEMSATGEVFSLTRIEDFEGQYAAASGAAIAGTSDMAVTYTNDKGVVVKLRGTVKGAGLSLGAGVATIKLVK